MDRLFYLSRLAAVTMAALVASTSSFAHVFVVPGCEAAEQLSDGSWLIKFTRNFGRAGEVEAGSLIWRGTLINGVDLGAYLEKRCFRRYRTEPDYPPYIWAPNGSANWTTPIP